MGQELLNRGVKPYGTLWGASALYDKKYHSTVVKTHLDFIKAGAQVIVTNSFGSRKRRLIENGLVKEYKNGFKSQARILYPYVDFFYLDVMSSLKECLIGLNAIKQFKKKILVGIHIRNKGLLPSGEKFITVAKKIEKFKPIGIIASCVSVEDLIMVMKDAKKLKTPFGFKINAFEHIPPGWKPDSNNPKVQLGKRKDLTPKKFYKICKILKSKGAKIIGGCCEITPKHIKTLKNLV